METRLASAIGTSTSLAKWLILKDNCFWTKYIWAINRMTDKRMITIIGTYGAPPRQRTIQERKKLAIKITVRTDW